MEFFAEYFYIFIILAVILIFAIIGYIIDSKDIKIEKPKTVKVDINSHGDIEELPKIKDDEDDDIETLDEVETLDVSEETINEADTIEAANQNPDLDKTEVLDTIMDEPNNNSTNEQTLNQLVQEQPNNESTIKE